jgi:hypothetical protein
MEESRCWAAESNLFCLSADWQTVFTVRLRCFTLLGLAALRTGKGTAIGKVKAWLLCEQEKGPQSVPLHCRQFRLAVTRFGVLVAERLLVSATGF